MPPIILASQPTRTRHSTRLAGGKVASQLAPAFKVQNYRPINSLHSQHDSGSLVEFEGQYQDLHGIVLQVGGEQPLVSPGAD